MERAAVEERLRRLLDVTLPTDGVVEFLNTMTRRLVSYGTWESLPEVWRQDVAQRSVDELRGYAWMMGDPGLGEVLPVHLGGLQNLARATRDLGLLKEPRAREKVQLCAMAKVGMTPKKVHECELFPSLVAEVGRECDVCLDIGCGNGYVSLVCSQLLGVPMVGLEGGDAMLSKKQFDKRLQLLQQEPLQKGQHKHVPQLKSAAIEDSTTVETFRKEAGLGEATIALAGLHCCGQLSVNVIRLFLADAKCRGMALVGCCYGRFGSLGHLMTFPLSQLCRGYPRLLELTTGAMRAATESPFLRRQDSKEEFEASMVLLFYRLKSEEILERELGRGNFRTERKVRKTYSNFAQYFRQLSKGIKGGDAVVVDDDDLNAEFARFYTAENMHRVAAQLAFKCSFAALLESIIVLDRVLFILESDATIGVDAFACFSPSISPTNFVIVATKPA